MVIQHVTEAAYLLKTSIVHVEQESIHLDDAEGSSMNLTKPTTTEESLDFDNMEVETPAIVKKSKITLSAEEYRKIVQQVILQIKKQERITGNAGMTRSAIVNWYLESMEESHSIETEEAFMYQRKVIKNVINRLVKQVSPF